MFSLVCLPWIRAVARDGFYGQTVTGNTTLHFLCQLQNNTKCFRQMVTGSAVDRINSTDDKVKW